MKQILIASLPLILLSTLTGCGVPTNSDSQNNPKAIKATNEIKKDDLVKTPKENTNFVTVNLNSPYQDYCRVLADYMTHNFDPTIFKHITIEYLILDAKFQNNNYPTGQVKLNIIHQPGKSSSYTEGENERYVLFKYNLDGTITLTLL